MDIANTAVGTYLRFNALFGNIDHTQHMDVLRPVAVTSRAKSCAQSWLAALSSLHMAQDALTGTLQGPRAVMQPDVNLEHMDQIPVSFPNAQPFGLPMLYYDGMRQHQSHPLVGGNA